MVTTLDDFVKEQMDGQLLLDSQRQARAEIEAAVRARKGLDGGVVVLMPPRFGKTSLAQQVLDWFLTIGPSGHLDSVAAYFSYSQEMVDSMRARLGRHVTEDVLKRSYFGGGRGGATVGRGFDLIVLDDPIKDRAEADSPTLQAQLQDWIECSVLTRLNPGGTFVFIGSRWGEDDAAGWLMKTFPEWPVVSIVAVDAAGQSTCPDRHSTSHLQRLKRALSPKTWAYLFQQGTDAAAA